THGDRGPPAQALGAAAATLDEHGPGQPADHDRAPHSRRAAPRSAYERPRVGPRADLANPRVLGVGDQESPVRSRRHPQGSKQRSEGRGAAITKGPDDAVAGDRPDRSVGRDLANAMVETVGDEKAAVCGDRDALRLVELSARGRTAVAGEPAPAVA